jgi:alpha-glucosidase
MLELYRAALALRRASPTLGDGDLEWLPAPKGVLAFGRGPDFACIVNLSHESIALPANSTVILYSGPLESGQLPTDTAAWLAR